MSDDYSPTLDDLESAAASVVREAENLLELARDELRRLQDFDAELADALPSDMLAARAARHVTRHRLRAISRQLTIAHAELVPVTDRVRFTAAQRLKGWVGDAQRADPPYLCEVG